MREIRKSGSMSGDGKRDHDAPGVQSTRARPRLYPRGEVKCLRRPSVRGARRLASGGVLDIDVLFPKSEELTAHIDMAASFGRMSAGPGKLGDLDAKTSEVWLYNT